MLEQSQHMIVVRTGLRHQVQEEWTVTETRQGQSGKNSAIETVRLTIGHHPQWRPVEFLSDVREAVQVSLNFCRAGQQ
jgi:hypothetical protein